MTLSGNCSAGRLGRQPAEYHAPKNMTTFPAKVPTIRAQYCAPDQAAAMATPKTVRAETVSMTARVLKRNLRLRSATGIEPALAITMEGAVAMVSARSRPSP